MLPGSPLQPPPPSVLLGLSFLPSPSPLGLQTLSISSSLAIVVIIITATAIITICIVLLRRGCRCRHRLSCSSLSPRCSFSLMASFSSSSPKSGVQSGASAAVCASPNIRAGMSSLEMVVVPSAQKEAGEAIASASVPHSSEWTVKGSELVAAYSAVGVIGTSASGVLVPSVPPLLEVERLIMELLMLSASKKRLEKSTVCLICSNESPTDVPLILPVCSHVFHRSCIITWLRCTSLPRYPSCHASITNPRPGKTNFCPDNKYDIESQMLVPVAPVEEVAEAVGGSHAWLRSSMDRLSGSLVGCSSNRATTVVSVCSRRNIGSWSLCSSDRLGNDSCCVEEQMAPSIPHDEQVSVAQGGSCKWLKSSLATLSGSWIGFSSDSSDAMVLQVYSKPITETTAPSEHNSRNSRSRRWDVEAATLKPEKSSVYDSIKWFFQT